MNKHPKLDLQQIWCSPIYQARYIGRFWRDFLPAGLKANRVKTVGNTVRIHSRSSKATAACPRCGTVSRHVHGRYRRRAADLPAHGRKVNLLLLVHWFRCRALRCPAKILAEPLRPDVPPPHARRTSRLQGLVRHLGLPLGGRPAQALAARLLLPVINDTFLRSIRYTAEGSSSNLRINGVDN
ncbi:transposase family protein [Phaeobacter gallaeciensis]|uniref:transposase family protein n=1 Tax=Phaeobacter gallaeciensis TaxID=60890 RepID=UPI00237F843B|nr:transposase family protein [Phaeobacter gallaeciensis]MDE4063837.1 transposase family protein [Phaeobacter gallaeciensis]MDE4126865.1 transposase family protein [Phaeobacter gallaeciensis]MDE4131332.1 transposase family protein [Phaeobacter gallaeciensis]